MSDDTFLWDSDLESISFNVTDGLVTVVELAGDLNGDGKCDMQDIGIAALAFGSSPGHPRWNPQADVKQDGKADMWDIALVAKDFGKTYS